MNAKTSFVAAWWILVALALGVIVGLVLNRFGAELWLQAGINVPATFLKGEISGANEPTALAGVFKFLIDANGFIGQAFVRALRFAAVPIVLFSIIAGVASLGDPRKLGRLGGATLGLYLVTTVLAVLIGLAIANVAGPGRGMSDEARTQLLGAQEAAAQSLVQRAQATPTGMSGMWSYLLNMIPSNPFDALARADMLQVIVVAVVIGFGLTLIPRDKSERVIGFCDAMADVMGVIVRAVMWVAPLGVFCLIVPVVASLGADVLASLAAYCLCVVGGLVFILVCVYGSLVMVLGGMNPLTFFKGMAPAMLVALTSSSSNATLPVTMRCVIERLGVSPKIANFVCPLGATVNMDGTALYQGIAVVFVAQVMGVELSAQQQAVIVLGATLASIGSPGIPGGSLVFLVGLLQSVGVPPQGIALILGVDRVLDMCRTVVNVSGDAMVAAVMQRWLGNRV